MTAPAVAADDAADYLNVRQAAAEFPALGLRFIERLRDERRIPIFKPAANRVLLRRSDIAAYIAATRIDPATRP